MTTYHHNPVISCGTNLDFRYTMIPKGLLECAPSLDISPEAVLLYCVLCDRARWSRSNPNFVDPDGRIYVILTRQRAAELMGWSKRKTIEMFKVLTTAGLIEEKDCLNRAGCTAAKHIYPKQWCDPSPRITMDQILRGGLDYLTPDNALVITGPYYRYPQVFLEQHVAISLRAKLLYTIGLDLLTLSAGKGYCDPDGAVWCKLDAEKTAHIFVCGHGAMSRAYAELEQIGLMYRVRKEYNSGMRVYLRPCWDVAAGDTDFELGQNYDQPNIAPQFSELRCCNDTVSAPQYAENETQINQVNHTYISQPDPASICAAPQEADAEKNRDCVDVAILCNAVRCDIPHLIPAHQQDLAYAVLQQISDVMIDDQLLQGNWVYIGKDWVPKSDLITAYQQLDRYILGTVLSKLVGVWETVKTPVPYLRMSLYRAHERHRGEAYFTRKKLSSA